MAKRKCFVIMPFSNTASTSAKDWTFIYEKLIKNAVENSGFDFECRRSKATRGNVIKEIINDLNESDLVIADMTDNNPNVCYELGIRHGLKVGTILLGQKRKFLQIFDLYSYASHVYKWKKTTDKQKLIKKIQELLLEYLENPDKADSPVQDFLQNKPSFSSGTAHEIEDILEFDSMGEPQILLKKKQLSGKLTVGLILLSKSKTGVTMNELVKYVSKHWKKVKTTDVSPIISQQMQGWVHKEGNVRNYTYRLSKKGRTELLELISLLKKQ